MPLSSVQESRLLAQAYLQAKPAEVQLRAREFFRSLDKDGDGFLRQEDLLGSAPLAEALGLSTGSDGGGPGPDRLRELFHTLDADRNGVLDFQECTTLYYLLSVRTRSCASCRACILSLGYTCTACWHSRASIHDTFDLCRLCFSFRSFSHHHDSFLDEHEMYNLMLFSSFYTNQRVQCKTCGDFHNKHSSSYLLKGESHMTQDIKDQDNFICEWCLTWQCSKCGVFFKGQMCSARPGQWLEKSRFCHRCGGQRKTKIDLETLLEDFKSKNFDRSCDTCKVKIQKGTLVFSSFANSSSSKKKTTSKNVNTIGMLDIMNNGFKSVEIGGKLCNTLVQKDMCPLM